MNIYVGNLPYTITKDELMDLFVGFGEVSSVNLITDKATGELRGFGFVEMPTQSKSRHQGPQWNCHCGQGDPGKDRT